MQSKAKTVERYLAELPEDRREAIAAIRAVILDNLPEGYEEGMGYGMITYHVPHDVYPPGYHCDPKQPLPFASLASQKNHMALYLMCLYSDAELEAWFREAWAKTGKKLDMGKSCLRFKKLDDIPLDLIGRIVRKVPVRAFIARYEAGRSSGGRHGSRATTAAKRAGGSKRKATSKSMPKSGAASGTTGAKGAGGSKRKATSKSRPKSGAASGTTGAKGAGGSKRKATSKSRPKSGAASGTARAKGAGGSKRKATSKSGSGSGTARARASASRSGRRGR